MDSTTIQGVLVEVHGTGVLLRGPSGCGKSVTALHLMDRGHRLVSDDVVSVSMRADQELVGAAPEEDVRIEVRGLGVFRAAALFQSGTVESVQIGLVVDLDVYDPYRDAGRIEPEVGAVTILGKRVPQVRLPLVAGINSAMLVELLVRWLRGQGAIGWQ